MNGVVEGGGSVTVTPRTRLAGRGRAASGPLICPGNPGSSGRHASSLRSGGRSSPWPVSVWGGESHQGLRTSKHRPLRPSAWRPGPVFTELHTGPWAGADPWGSQLHLPAGGRVPTSPTVRSGVGASAGAELTRHPGPHPANGEAGRCPAATPGSVRPGVLPERNVSPQLLPHLPPLPSPSLGQMQSTVHILAGESEKRPVYHSTSCSAKNIVAFFYGLPCFRALP